MSSSSIAAAPPAGEYSEEDYWFLLLSELGSEGGGSIEVTSAAAALQETQRSDDAWETMRDDRNRSCIITTGEKEQEGSHNRPHQPGDGILPTTTSTTDTATVERQHGPVDQVEIVDGLRDIGRIECMGGYSGMTGVWEESEECISDRIEFIFCNNFEFDGYDYSDYNEGEADSSSSSRYGNMFKFTIPLALQPTLRLALDYAIRSMNSCRSTAYDTTLMLQRPLRDGLLLLQRSSSQLTSADDHHSSWMRYPSNVHDNMLFLARHLQATPLRQLVSTSAGGIVHLRDIAVARLAQYIRTNIYLTSLVGCVHESTLFMVDRIQAGVELYSHLIQGDDPAHIHLRAVKDSPDWKHLLLRCSMASLTWRQRQLLEETRDGGSLCDADLKRLMEAQVTDHDRQRIAGISSEFFTSLSGGHHHHQQGTAAWRQPLDEMQPQQGTIIDPVEEDNRSLDHRLVTRHTSSSSNSSSNECFQSGEMIDTELQLSSSSCGGDDDAFQSNVHVHAWLIDAATEGDEDAQYALAKFFTPPPFSEQSFCAICIDRVFSIVAFRHHCRFCGRSVCHEHSPHRRCIYRFGIVQPVRVCSQCVQSIDATHLMDELIWKDLRVSSFLCNRLIPYSHPCVDRGVDKVMRVTDYSLSVAKNALAFNFTAKFALDTLDVLKRYGLTGFTGLLLRKDFMESICMLMKISGMESIIALSIHELTACVYYKLAIERGIRGCNPDSELISHAPTDGLEDSGGQHFSRSGRTMGSSSSSSSYCYCRSADDDDIDHAISLAPLALNIVYEEDPADCQRLAKLQGWDLIFTNAESDLAPEQPCFALFGCSFPAEGIDIGCNPAPATDDDTTAPASPAAVSSRQLQAVLAIRGTQTIQDVVTDIKASPQLFPPPHDEIQAALQGLNGSSSAAQYRMREGEGREEPGSPTERRGSQSPSDWDWLSVPLQHTYACGGMVRAAMYVLKEVGPALRRLHAAGYQVTMVGHSLGGAVAALLTFLLEGCMPSIQCITYGCPSCVDSLTADLMLRSRRVLSVVLRDDVICRITPQSIRLLLRELVVFREEMFQHLQQEWLDILTRASSVWSPRVRNIAGSTGISTTSSSSSSLSKLDMSSKSSGTSSIDKATVIVEEEALTQLWIPGRIVHIYRHRGRYCASEVSRDFSELRTIAMQGNIFDDHRSEKIFNALLEVRAVRRASRAAPVWVPFNACDPVSGEGLRCSCCRNDFSWHSTFTGQAQDFRDKFNCRYCGRLVCGPCSSQSRAMPQYGFVFPMRICDHCLYKGDFANV